MNFCIDCAYYKQSYGVAECHRPLKLSPVDGKQTVAFCAIERKYDTEDSCGMEGKFFKKKEEV